MERDLFAKRLREAGKAARDFGQQFIEESLPEELRFRIRLNSSYDGNPLVGDETLYPDDASYERLFELRECSAEQAIETLWRGGQIPEWINATVIGLTESASLVELVCCGRFTASDKLLYHEREGRPPFHVLGPSLPPEYEIGSAQRFSIYERTECWTVSDLERLEPHAHKVWSLELIGRAFDDDVLLAVPEFQSMELMTLKHSAIAGRGLIAIVRQPRLRGLTISFDPRSTLRVPELPKLKRITSLALHRLPPHPWGSERLLSKLHNVGWLLIEADGDLSLDGTCSGNVERLVVTAKRLHGTFKPPPQINSLSIHVADAREEEVVRLLSSVKRVASLSLRSCPISDRLAEELPKRFKLDSLDLYDTGVTPEALARIRAAYPELRLLPHRDRE